MMNEEKCNGLERIISAGELFCGTEVSLARAKGMILIYSWVVLRGLL